MNFCKSKNKVRDFPIIEKSTDQRIEDLKTIDRPCVPY